MDVDLAALGTITGVVSGIAAVGSWMAARAANRAATTLKAIEHDRWHTDLTPQFVISCRATSDIAAELRLALAGPAGLDRLDEVIVGIRDDGLNHTPVDADWPTAEQVAWQIWGPYRFRPGVDGADRSGRTVAPIELQLGDWRSFALERTLPPTWMADGNAGEQWRQDYAGQPMRLTITCRRKAHKPWTIPVELQVEPVLGIY